MCKCYRIFNVQFVFDVDVIFATLYHLNANTSLNQIHIDREKQQIDRKVWSSFVFNKHQQNEHICL